MDNWVSRMRVLLLTLLCLLALPREGGGVGFVYPEAFHAVGDGLTDDSAALKAAFNYAQDTGEAVILTNRYRYASDLRVPAGIAVVGFGAVGGAQLGDDYRNVRPALVPTRNATLLVDGNTILRGFAVVADAINPPKDYRNVAEALAGWTGTAVQIGTRGAAHETAADVRIEDLFIIGFATCIESDWADRLTIARNKGQCLNGIAISQSHDVSRVSDNHFWPFFIQGHPNAALVAKINNVVTNGKTTVVTLARNHKLLPGDVVSLTEPNGVLGRVRAATILSVPGNNSVELDGTADNSLIGGVLFFAPGLKGGTAFSVDHSEAVFFTGNFSYAFARHVYCGPGSEWIQFHDQGVDGALLAQAQDSVGYYIDGDADRVLVEGGFISGVAQTATIDTSSNHAVTFSNVAINRSTKGVFDVRRGRLLVVGGDIASSAPTRIADGVAGVVFRDVQQSNPTISFESSKARLKFSQTP